MPKSSAFMLNRNNVINFHDDGSLPQDIRNQSFKVTRIDTLLLNDFYFNQELFPSYELTGESGNAIYLSPFHFEEDEEELKLRITKNITLEDLQQLCKPHHPKEILNLQQDKNNYFSIDDIQAHLKNWLGRTYYIDIKEQEIATSTYIAFDSSYKKNVNYSLLLKKYPSAKYSLFLGDYNSYYIEVNFEQIPQVRVTTYLSFSDIESVEAKESEREKIQL